eukprot:scaffold42984_cov221-Amphora_coffeaeformis.AAC.2
MDPPSLFLFASSIALTLVAARFSQQLPFSTKSHDGDQEHPDAFYLRKAHQLRKALTKPAQSRFRVVAIFLLDNKSLVFGANDEAPPTISGSLCAERGAFLQYRLLQYEHVKIPKIRKIYIVTDSDVPVPPGLLCREYMYGHPAVTDTTPIIMQSADEGSAPWVSNLQELYPHPSRYMKLSVEEQLVAGQAASTTNEKKLVVLTDSLQPQEFSTNQIHKVLAEAQRATLEDNKDEVHPIRYGAAVLWVEGREEIRMLSASQRKTLEYGSTQDAVAQLLSRVLFEEKHGQHSNGKEYKLLLAQVDQFGVVHPPFAAARAFLVEHGFGEVQVVVPSTQSDGDDSLTIASARKLAPFVPEWK